MSEREENKKCKKYKGVVQINELRKTEATTCYCILYNPARHLSLPLIHIYALSRDWRWPLSRNVVSARETEREGERGHRLFNNAAGAGSLSDIYMMSDGVDVPRERERRKQLGELSYTAGNEDAGVVLSKFVLYLRND